jgi:ABC-type nitrate/sulfonate/bicarbonate transport system ATPase subunit
MTQHNGPAAAGSAQSGTLLEVTAVGKSFRLRHGERLEVLRQISFAVSAEELVAIIGPSGCGKTTLLRIIDGLAAADDGTVLLDGKRVTEPSPGLAMVFQDGRILPWKTVQQNVEFALELKYHRRLRRDERDLAREYVDAVGLTRFASSYPYQLSGGMQQRVGVARALVRLPRVLLLDEPFGALDAQTRLVMQDLFLSLQERYGLTAVLVTHDIDEAVYMSHRCIVLGRNPGHVKATVRIELPTPRHRYDVRAASEFGRYRSDLWNLLREDVSEAVIEDATV